VILLTYDGTSDTSGTGNAVTCQTTWKLSVATRRKKIPPQPTNNPQHLQPTFRDVHPRKSHSVTLNIFYCHFRIAELNLLSSFFLIFFCFTVLQVILAMFLVRRAARSQASLRCKTLPAVAPKVPHIRSFLTLGIETSWYVRPN
jgi:hypothetical protein